MARSARDLALALNAIAGPAPDDAKAWTWQMPAPRRTRIKDFRIGCVLDDTAAPVIPDVAAVYENTLSAISKTGAKLDRGWPSGVDGRSHINTFAFLLSSLVTADMPEAARSFFRERLKNNPDDAFAAGAVEPHARWMHETQRRLAFRALWQKYFESHDLFLLPTTFTAAFPHDHSEPIDNRVVDTPQGKRPYAQSIPYWITFASLAGLPATVAPVGTTAGGLPVGIQIIAPMWEDGTAIEFAALLADVVGGFEAPPAFRG